MKKNSVAATTITTGSSQVAPATDDSSTAVSQQATTPSSSSSSTGTSNYKDGTYSASSSYYVPNGNESIKVTLTLSNGTVTNASVQNSEYDRTSAAFQQDFAAEYKSYVVGQKIANLQLGIIAGASDTTQGFNDALNQISSQAQA